LQEAAVAADCVAHTVLCCAMEFWWIVSFYKNTW
jgi:hypothetical protein